jgi:hypothetical protein
MSRGTATAKEEQETFRLKVINFLEEKLKKGVLIKYDNAEVEMLLDPSADYDVMAKRVNDSVTITVYSRYATCTIRVRVGKDGEWRLRSLTCRRA